MKLNVYLAGEIHTNWRDELILLASERGLPIFFGAPVTNHEESDMVGVNILGAEESPYWRDRKGAGVNGIRTRTLMEKSDLVIARFGTKYRQWNTAFEAGYASALGKPLIVIHDPELDHALKEVDCVAMAVAQTPVQVIEVLAYVCS
ncbi:MAG: YtoQ family protein [Myxococcota bacterium]|nr:YtoQ family protein [Myxococcota bacterium]